MHDRNVKRMAWVASVLILALLGFVYGQSHAVEAEREGKRSACEQAKSMLEKAAVATAAAPDHPAGEHHPGRGAEDQQHAAREKAFVDAVTKCTLVAISPDEGRLVISFFVAGTGLVVALIALLLNGMRYDAGMRNAFGGCASALEITPDRRVGGRVWNVRNVGLGPETIIGVSTIAFPRHGPVRLFRSSFEHFVGERRIEVGETLPIDATATGDDLLVAVLSEHVNGRHSASWARFRAIEASGAYEKCEEGSHFSI